MQDGIPEEQGAWVHPYIAINLAQWCSQKFAVIAKLV
ncbi:MAG: KilA-N domain-containing protein [Candidatus Marithrix sp.]|nr:KilA-N domain-containing protein [Candidatus Marithrix sp.]